MTQLITQELAIVIAVKTQNPTILNEDFLKQSGIIPSDWKLARDPIYTERVAQIVFENGFSIAAQPDRVMFLEAVGDKPIDSINAGTVAQKYVNTLKLADYQAIGINFRSYVAYPNEALASQFISTQLLANGSWQSYGESFKASLNLVYDLNTRQLNLSINEASIQFPDQLATPVVLFAGNFSYDIANLSIEERVKKIDSNIGNWQNDLAAYTELINERFLTKNTIKSVDIYENNGIVNAIELPSVLDGTQLGSE